MKRDFHSKARSWLGGLAFLAAGMLLSNLVQADVGESNPLADTKWQLVEFTSMDDAQGITRPHDPQVYTMHLKADGSVAMQLNCNRVMGSWSIGPAADGNSGRFEFGPLAGTRALCPPPSMDETILAQSSFIRGYLLKGGWLYLSLMADAGVYTWEPLRDAAYKNGVPVSGNDGGPLNWEVTGVSTGLNLREKPSTSARVVDRYPAGTILDNYGCQQVEDRVWCDVQRLGGGPVGYVAAEFLKPAVSPNGAPIYGPDDSALRAGQGEFDATGYIPCGQTSEQPMTECEFGVARTGGGYATVVVKRPDGFSRAIFFRIGRAIGADTSEADGYHGFSVVEEGDLFKIHVGPERYEIPSAVIFGG